MKAFIDKVFSSKKQKQKEILDEITSTEVVEENKKILTKQIEKAIIQKIEQHTDTKDD